MANMKKSLLIISLLLIFCISLGAVSAVDMEVNDSIQEDSVVSAIVVGGDINGNGGDSTILVLKEDSAKNFNDLNEIIANATNGSSIVLEQDYKYDSGIDGDFLFGVVIDKSITIDGQGHTIDGSNLAHVFNVIGNNVTIKNINFINAIASDDKNGSGGAIYWNGADGSVSGCNFINCSAVFNGGAIDWWGVNGSVSDCSFTDCSADYGGAIVCWADSFIMSSSNFTNCNAEYCGAIWESSDNSILIDCNFINCSADYDGGAIGWFGVNGSVSGCSFVDCSAGEDGGAICWEEDNGCVSDCSFINCSADYGGAISWYGRNNGSVSGCSFTDCSSSSFAGAIGWEGYDGSIDGCDFINCSAGEDGGAVIAYGDNICVGDCDFINCSAGEDGGAVIVGGDNICVGDCDFINCSAVSDAGAIYWYGCANGSVDGCSFVGCSAGEDGGAINWLGYDGSVDCCSFVGCSAEYGSAICINKYTYENNTTIGSLSITDSTCTSLDGDEKAPIYNKGTILSDVVITTLNAKNRNANYGDEITLTATMTTSGIPVAGGIMMLKVNGEEIEATSDINGLYSGLYTVDFVGTKPVTANYLNSTGQQTVNPYNITVIKDKSDYKNDSNTKSNVLDKNIGNMKNTGNPLFVLLIALSAIGLESFRRKL